MNTPIRARHAERGFSFVELLVTIIIAGIAFAALVPVFVSANQKNSADIVRNAALQTARDKIEALRLVPYDQLELTNLNDPTFQDGRFGESETVHLGSGNRVIGLSYVVTSYPTANAPDQQTYKQVTVTATWDSPPKPIVPVVLSTVVYKQYAGPQIVNFAIGTGPPSVLTETPSGSDTYWITGSPTLVDAYLDPADLGSMTSGADKGYVRFMVTSLDGVYSVKQDVSLPVTGEPAHYQWAWGNYAVADGVYIFSATAYSAGEQQGNVVSYGMYVHVTTPPAPTHLAGVPMNTANSLTWDTSPIGNFHHYELQRSMVDPTDPAFVDTDFTYLAGDGAGTPPSLSSPSYTDSGLTNGTPYWYRVRVWNLLNNSSPWSAVVGPLTPAAQTDFVAPSVPGGLSVATVANANALTLSFSGSTDGGVGSLGVRGYDVQRSPDGSTWQQVLSAAAFNQLTYTDTGLSWNTPYYYRVRAVDWAGNSSAWTAAVRQTTVAQPKWTLTVTNTNGSSSIIVRVQSTTTPFLWWVAGNGNQAAGSHASDTGGTSINKSKLQNWLQLPQDNYNVWTASSEKINVSLTGDAAVSFSN